MRPPQRVTFVLAAALTGGLWGCFVGTGTLGSVCISDAQCGLDQRCQNSLCGQCNDNTVQAGELCFGNSSEEYIFGQVSDLLSYRASDDFYSFPIAVMNHNCELPPNRAPPGSGDACWDIVALTLDNDGDFEPLIPAETPKDGTVSQITTGDFNGEKSMDIALAVSPSSDLLQPAVALFFDFNELLARLANEEVVQPDYISISRRARTIHAADLTGDGLDDLIIGSELDDTLLILRADRNSELGFAPEQFVVTEPLPRPAAPVDMDNDGDLDLVLYSQGNRRLAVALNDGNGNITTSPGPSFDDNGLLTPQDLTTADFDQDGILDVVLLLAAPFTDTERLSQLRIYRGLGDGSLEFYEALPGGEFPISAIAEDINFDGWPDIIVADIREDKLPVHINREGSFPDVVTIDVSAAPRALVFADADRNDIPDLIVANANAVVAVVPAEN